MGSSVEIQFHSINIKGIFSNKYTPIITWGYILEMMWCKCPPVNLTRWPWEEDNMVNYHMNWHWQCLVVNGSSAAISIPELIAIYFGKLQPKCCFLHNSNALGTHFTTKWIISNTFSVYVLNHTSFVHLSTQLLDWLASFNIILTK